jgi:hypothetical protein
MECMDFYDNTQYNMITLWIKDFISTGAMVHTLVEIMFIFIYEYI